MMRTTTDKPDLRQVCLSCKGLPALKRGIESPHEDAIEIDGLRIDPICHSVTAEGDPVAVTVICFRLLYLLMLHPGRVYRRERLLDLVWSEDIYINTRTVDVHIHRLRKALAQTGHDALIETVRGVGYRFAIQRTFRSSR